MRTMATYESSITLFVNGQKCVVSHPDPNKTLQEYLTEIGFTGTKLSCGQGACGACTVNLARSSNGVITERAVNACLRPLVLCDGCSVVTTEGLGTAVKPHPVQERIACLNGSQCGFCTPGQVMSMYSLLREKEQPTAQEVESCLEGNICRCTGYRAIHAAFHTFAGKHATTDVPGYPREFSPYSKTCDPTFPKDLIDYPLKPLHTEANGNSWYRVTSLEQWAAIVKASPTQPRAVVGNTSVGVFGQKVGRITNVDISAVEEIIGLKSDASGVTIGGAETLTTLITALKAGNAAQQTLAGSLTKIANNNVRNAGGWAGNLVMGRVINFPSDGMVLLSAFGASVCVAVAENGAITKKNMSVASFLEDGTLNDSAYVLVSLTVPAITAHFHTYRQGMSKVNSHALVNAAFRTNLTADGVLKDPVLVFGCISKRTVIAREAMSFLEGKKVQETTLQSLLDILRKTINVETDPTYVTGLRPEGKTDFKRQAVQSFAFKWFASLVPSVKPELRSMVARSPGFWESRDESHSTAQELTSVAQLGLPSGHPGAVYVGPKLEAYEQACGQTRYSGDMPMGARGTYGYFVTAKEVGVLERVDASAALAMEGVLAFVDHSSIPGLNSCSFVPEEEPLFCPPGKEILYSGQLIGVVVALNFTQAKAAARSVKVHVSPPSTPPIFTIDEAVAKQSFLYGPDVPGKDFTIGDPKSAFEDPSNVIAEGEFCLGGQNHFYMEKQTVTAFPEDMGRIGIYGGTQGPDVTKTMVMLALGCSSKDIVIQNRPMGGAFGGKFTKQIPVFCATAVASKATGRPVRLAMDIETDMGCSGHTRHILKCKYKTASTPEGKLVAVDTNLLVDAGHGNDYTDYIVDEILKRQDLAYDIPNYHCNLTICRTNNASATPVRAPGLAQAAAISETLIDAVARRCKVSQERVRELSLKPATGAKDQTGQEVPEWNMPGLWKMGKEKLGFERREKACEEFNAANRFKKRGTAMMPLKYAVGYINLSGAQVTVNINSVDGTVAIQTGSCEMGQGCLTKVVAACASCFGIPIEKVSAFYPNTSVLPNLTTDGGSAGAEVLCQATLMACEKLKDVLKPIEQQLICEKQERGEEATATWEEICGRAQGPMPTDTRTLLSASAQHKVKKWNDLQRSADHPPPELPYWNLDPAPPDAWQYYVTGLACSDVEVDVTTGAYTILRSDVIMDSGHSLNPLVDLGQAEGAFVYGIGTYLQEDVLVNPEDGTNMCEGTWNYKPPNNKDAPQVFNVELLPGNPSSKTAFGSKGMGEPPLLLAYSVVSALKKAITASRIERGLSDTFSLDSPATVDRVQECMGLRPSELSLERQHSRI